LAVEAITIEEDYGESYREDVPRELDGEKA
jgi:hypothetical protein